MRSIEEFLGVGIALELANLRELLRQQAAAGAAGRNIPHIISALDRVEREAQAQFDRLVGKPARESAQTSLEDLLREFAHADMAVAICSTSDQCSA